MNTTTKRKKIHRVSEWDILYALKMRGGFASAPEIAKQLGMCRQSVYSAVKRLNKKGYRIEGEAGVGFIIRKPSTVHIEVAA
jgi:biotin operon repressor